METTNTCTTLALFNSDVEKYMSAQMSAFSKTLKGCAICGTTTANVYVLICAHGAHHACNNCAKFTSKITKTESTRGGTKTCCGVPQCKALALDKPIPAPDYTAHMVHGTRMLEYEVHEAKSAALRHDHEDTSIADAARAEVRTKRKRRTKAEMIEEEGEEAYAERKAGEREAKAARLEAKREIEANKRCRAVLESYILTSLGYADGMTKLEEIEGDDFGYRQHAVPVAMSDSDDDGSVVD